MLIASVTHEGRTYINMTAEQLREVGVPDSVFRATHLKSYAADKRWAIENGGVAFGGAVVPTDDRSKALLTGAAASMAASETTKVKLGGAFVDMTGTQIKALRDAVVDHVQACFQAEADVAAAIDAGTITATAAIDAFAWPKNT